MAKQFNTLNLTDDALSDLFFNHDHPNYDALFKPRKKNEDGPSPEEIKAAILKDAQQFAENFGGWTGEQYAQDFLNRL